MNSRRDNGRYGTGKEALLRAVVTVVSERGLRGLTFRSVAECAGVNNSLVAHHFGTRDALIAAALDWAAQRSIGASDLRDAIVQGRSFTEALIDFLLQEPDLQVFQYEMILEARRRPELSDNVKALYDNYVSALAEGLEAAGVTGDVRVMGRMLFAALDGLVLQYLAGVDRGTISASLEEVHTVMLRIANIEATAN